jgi:DNA-binding FadR family transcriptional regulator
VLLQPVEKQTLAKVVMQRLVEYIQGDALRSGDPLPSQHDLARQLSVSRPVLREAMQGLASVGMIEIRPGSGCYVRDPRGPADSDALFEVLTHETALEVRMVVEVELAGLAAERASDADFRRLEAILARLKRAVARGQPTSQITSDFHRSLARAGHNAVLDKMAHLLTRPRLAQGLRVEHALPDIMAGEYDSHRALYDAVATRDPAVARAALRRHLEIAHGWEEQIAALQRQIARSAV